MANPGGLHQDFFFICFCVRRGIFLFDFRDGCLFDGVDHVEKLKVFLVIVAGFEDVRGHGAGAQPRLAWRAGKGPTSSKFEKSCCIGWQGVTSAGGGTGDSGGGGGSEVAESTGVSVSDGVSAGAADSAEAGSAGLMSLSMLQRPGRLS